MDLTSPPPVCPRCGLPPRDGLTHVSMINDIPDQRTYPGPPPICQPCMLIELEEYRRHSRVLPYSAWWCNDQVSLAAPIQPMRGLT